MLSLQYAECSTPVGGLTLLGLLLGDNGLELALDIASGKLQMFCNRLESLDAYTVLFFLVHYASASRLSYVLRIALVYKHKRCFVQD